MQQSTSALLLRMHSGIICQTRFWVLIRIPIRCFMFSQLFLFGILKQDIIFPSPLEYSAITKSNIIFAFTLLTLAKKMIAIHNVAIGNYMAISAYGIIVSFATIAHSVIHTPYPPLLPSAGLLQYYANLFIFWIFIILQFQFPINKPKTRN